MADISYTAVGRRKSSIASVVMTPGSGEIVVNKRAFDTYFPRPSLRMVVRQPLEFTGMATKFDIRAKVTGGGLSGQADAMRLGISRALVKLDSELRSRLKKEGFLTRDPREKERKKYGQPGARKRFQFSKR